MSLAASLIAELDDQALDQLAALLAPRLTTDGRPEWLDVAGAAEHLACKPQRIYDLVNQRRLKPGRDGKRLLFNRTDLDAYLRSTTR